MNTQNVGSLPPDVIRRAIEEFGSPLYLYDEGTIRARCRAVLSLPNAFGLHVRYAMKANPNRAILQIIADEGVGIDASSVNEARRARLAGIAADRITLTSQQYPVGEARGVVEGLIREGMTYNACSLHQLRGIADFAGRERVPLSLRVNPGVGSGESVTRNTGDKYSSFGIVRSNLAQATDFARQQGLHLAQVHVHIGSGGDPAQWRDNIDRMLSITEQHFGEAHTLNLGGGFKEARMPDESAADIVALGSYARDRFQAFADRTQRELAMAVEPGTYIVANSGYLVSRVTDKKSSGADGFEFVLLDAGMEANTRPLLYGSRHPFYVVSASGELLSSEFDVERVAQHEPRVVVGRCCESGDAQSLDHEGKIIPRRMADPALDDIVVIGGAGAYCAAMSLVNYNSYTRPPEVLRRRDGRLALIRRRQTFDQMVEGELGLDA